MGIFHFAEGIIKSDTLPHTPADSSTLDTILLILFSVIGGIMILVVVLAGSKYIFSSGNPEAVQKAKSELIYAIIGLVLVVLSAAIVNYVVGLL